MDLVRRCLMVALRSFFQHHFRLIYGGSWKKKRKHSHSKRVFISHLNQQIGSIYFFRHSFPPTTYNSNKQFHFILCIPKINTHTEWESEIEIRYIVNACKDIYSLRKTSMSAFNVFMLCGSFFLHDIKFERKPKSQWSRITITLILSNIFLYGVNVLFGR